jgi:hypothetical protein
LHADIPQIISYQGKVTDSGGTPVADGSYTMRFQIYDQLIGGSPLWDSGAQSVDLADGIFSVMLGGTGHPELNLAFDDDYWLQVAFEGTIQSPRRRLGSVGYSYMASGLVPGTEVMGSITEMPWAALKATNSGTTNDVVGLYGESGCPGGGGVFGHGTATSDDTYGVFGYTSSNEGMGVYGLVDAATGTTFGGRFESTSTSGRGVYGEATASTGFTYGVYGISASTNGMGVIGEASAGTGVTNGVYGLTGSTEGKGVFGNAPATTGVTYGVYGRSTSPSGTGVHGLATAGTGITYGVYGTSGSESGQGVHGSATATTGATYGVRGESESTDGIGVFGSANASTGITYGVRGETESSDGSGVFGVGSNGQGNSIGVQGETYSTNGRGVYGAVATISVGGTAYGVYGTCSPSRGIAVYASGDFAASGTKSCVVKTSQGPTLMYCQESPGNWFEDFGEGELITGRCHVDLDPLFLETVTIDEANPLKVYVTPNGAMGEWWVDKGSAGFTVVALEADDGTRFDYRVVAKRKGFEQKRLGYCKAAETDSYLYPELSEE